MGVGPLDLCKLIIVKLRDAGIFSVTFAVEKVKKYNL